MCGCCMAQPRFSACGLRSTALSLGHSGGAKAKKEIQGNKAAALACRITIQLGTDTCACNLQNPLIIDSFARVSNMQCITAWLGLWMRAMRSVRGWAIIMNLEASVRYRARFVLYFGSTASWVDSLASRPSNAFTRQSFMSSCQCLAGPVGKHVGVGGGNPHCPRHALRSKCPL